MYNGTRLTELSPRRKTLKILGVVAAILGAVTIIYAAVAMEAAYFRIQAGPDESLGVAQGETRFAQFGVGFVGIAMIFVGYRLFTYIPYSEREREQVTELDL